MLLSEVLTVAETSNAAKDALERSLKQARRSMHEQAAAIAQVAEQASIDAERVADADREMGVLRGKLQEMQEALEQQQENGMHHRQQLKDALAQQEQETATHRQAVSDTQVKLQETQARLDRALERSTDADREMSSLRSKLQEAQDELEHQQELIDGERGIPEDDPPPQEG